MSTNMILGIFNSPKGDRKVRGWTIPTRLIIEAPNPKSGDYAIVENGNDYSLVKVIGVIYAIDEKYAWRLGGKKEVVKFIPRAEVRED